jgi:hypothetical protein
MNPKHVFRKAGPVNRFFTLVAAAAITGIVIRIGQTAGYYLAGIDSSADPIEATAKFGMILMWVVTPAAALAGGLTLRLSAWPTNSAAVGVGIALLPIWVVFFLVRFEPIRVLQVFLCFAVALAPFAISSSRHTTNGRRSAT